MERQYIGARYVPILVGAWDRNKSYEALTIVQTNNSSYTSKKPVPPGIDISNTEYWVLTGNYNGQVEEYRQAAETAINGVNEINGKLANYDKIVTLEDLGGSYEADDNSAALNNLPSGKRLVLTGNCKITSTVILADKTAIEGVTQNALLTVDANFNIGSNCAIANLRTKQTAPICLSQTGCYLSNIYFEGNCVLLIVRHSLHKIIGCNFVTTTTHLLFEKTAANVNINTTVCGCMFGGTGTSLEIVGGPGGHVEGVVFVGNTIMSQADIAINMREAYGIILTGNVIDQYKVRAISITSSNHITICGNWLGSNEAQYGGALYIDKLTGRVIFNGNIVLAIGESSYVCSGTGSYLVLTNNICEGRYMTLFKTENEDAKIICTGNQCSKAFDPLSVTVKGIVANNVLEFDPGTSTNGLTVANNVF